MEHQRLRLRLRKDRHGWWHFWDPELMGVFYVHDGHPIITVRLKRIMGHDAVPDPDDNMNFLVENKYHVIAILKFEVLKIQGSKHVPFRFSIRFGSSDWLHLRVTCIWTRISAQLDTDRICFESLGAHKLDDKALEIFTNCEIDPLADWDLDEIHRRLMNSFDPKPDVVRLHDPVVRQLLVDYLIGMAKHYAGGDVPLPDMPKDLLPLCGLGVM